MHARLLSRAPNGHRWALAANATGLLCGHHGFAHQSTRPNYKVKRCASESPRYKDSRNSNKTTSLQDTITELSAILAFAAQQSEHLNMLRSKLAAEHARTGTFSDSLMLEFMNSIPGPSLALLHATTKLADAVQILVSSMQADGDVEEVEDEDATEAAMRWFTRDKGYTVDSPPEGIFELVDTNNQCVAWWYGMFIIKKEGRRVLVVVESPIFSLNQEELLDKIQKTKHYLQHLHQNPPTPDSPYEYTCLYDWIKYSTNCSELVVVASNPFVNDELLQFAEAHGILLMLQELLDKLEYKYKYSMQPTNLVL